MHGTIEGEKKTILFTLCISKICHYNRLVHKSTRFFFVAYFMNQIYLLLPKDKSSSLTLKYRPVHFFELKN